MIYILKKRMVDCEKLFCKRLSELFEEFYPDFEYPPEAAEDILKNLKTAIDDDEIDTILSTFTESRDIWFYHKISGIINRLYPKFQFPKKTAKDILQNLKNAIESSNCSTCDVDDEIDTIDRTFATNRAILFCKRISGLMKRVYPDFKFPIKITKNVLQNLINTIDDDEIYTILSTFTESRDKWFCKRLSELIEWFDPKFQFPIKTAKDILQNLKSTIENLEENSLKELLIN